MKLSHFARVSRVALLFLAMTAMYITVPPAQAEAAPQQSTYCGDLGEYTAWHWTGGQWKPVLWVWNNGHSTPYPQYVIVHYNNQVVPNTQKGVLTSGTPQVDQGNGWVGYFISKTWIGTTGWDWENDSKWRVTGCVEQ